MINNKVPLSGSVLSGLTVIIILYLLIFNMVNIWPHLFHSDAAASIIINNEARHEEAIIPSDWYYVNGDLFHYAVLAAPFVGKEDFSFSSHLIAEFFGLIILILCATYFSFVFFRKLSMRLMFISVMLCGLSYQNARFVFFEQAYLLILSLMLLASALAFTLLTSKVERWNIVKLAMFGVVVVVLVILNPMRSITTIIPLAVVVSVFGFLWQRRTQFFRISFTIIVSVVTGSLIYLLFSFNKTIIYGASSFSFTEINEIPNKLLVYVAFFIEYLGINSSQGGINFGSTLSGLLLKAFMVGGLLLFFYRIINARGRIISARDGQHGDGISAAGFLFLLFVFSFMLGSIAIILMKNLLIDVSSIRYQTVSVAFLFAWLISEYGLMLNKCDYNRFIYCCCLVFLSITFVITAFNVYMPPNLSGYKNIPEKKMIAQILEAKNAEIAYGTYWNSSVVTVFSNAKVHVLPITILPVMKQMNHLSSDRLWRNRLKFNESALILTKPEYDYIESVSGDFSKALPYLKEIIPINDKFVIIYEHNLARYFSMQNQLISNEKIRGEFDIIGCQDCSFNSKSNSNLDVSFSFYNRSDDMVLSSSIENPFNIGVSLLNANGEILERDFARIPFYRNVFPNESIVFKASFHMGLQPGKYYLMFALVKEGKKWYVNDDGPVRVFTVIVN